MSTHSFHTVVSRIDSENRYIVKIPQGEALYIASEVSTPAQRCLCGAGRGFVMHLHDNTRQEALVLHRRLAAASCLFPCRLQVLTLQLLMQRVFNFRNIILNTLDLECAYIVSLRLICKTDSLVICELTTALVFTEGGFLGKMSSNLMVSFGKNWTALKLVAEGGRKTKRDI